MADDLRMALIELLRKAEVEQALTLETLEGWSVGGQARIIVYR